MGGEYSVLIVMFALKTRTLEKGKHADLVDEYINY